MLRVYIGIEFISAYGYRGTVRRRYPLETQEKNLTQSTLAKLELAKLLGAERKWVINLESGNSRVEIGPVQRALQALNLRASITDGEKPKTRGTLRDASLLDEVFRNLQQTSRK